MAILGGLGNEFETGLQIFYRNFNILSSINRITVYIKIYSELCLIADCPNTPRDLFFDKYKGFYCLQLIDRK